MSKEYGERAGLRLRRMSEDKREILARYRETETDIDLETSFWQDGSGVLDVFDTKINDWKLRKLKLKKATRSRKESSNFNAMEIHNGEDLIGRGMVTDERTRQLSATYKIDDNERRQKIDDNERSSRYSSSEIIDSVLQKYEIQERLGKGAFASVFRATHRVTGRDIAVKQIEFNTEDDIRELMGEINVLKSLRHEHIVKYHGFVLRNSTLNIFLEYCDGGSLRDLYRRIARFNRDVHRVTRVLLTEGEIKFYTAQVLRGLAYLHGEGVVHRDIKAANILLRSHNVVKLADFGVSTKINVNTVNIRNLGTNVVGTPNWMAPEVISLESVSTASDIWSLGATIVELYTGHPPYHDLNPMAALHAIVCDDYPAIPKSMSASAVDFLMQCFQKDPKQRASAHTLSNHPWLQDLESQDLITWTKPEHQRIVSDNSSSSTYSSVKQRAPSQSNSLLKYAENDHDDWSKDFSNINFSKLKIEDSCRKVGN